MSQKVLFLRFDEGRLVPQQQRDVIAHLGKNFKGTELDGVKVVYLPRDLRLVDIDDKDVVESIDCELKDGTRLVFNVDSVQVEDMVQLQGVFQEKDSK